MENHGKTGFFDGKLSETVGTSKVFRRDGAEFFAGNFMEFHVHFINSMNTSCTFRWELLQGPWIGFCWGFNGNFIINIGQASQVYGKKQWSNFDIVCLCMFYVFIFCPLKLMATLDLGVTARAHGQPCAKPQWSDAHSPVP